MTNLDAEVVLAALAAQDVPALLLRERDVVARNEATRLLGDLDAVLREGATFPCIVREGGRCFELRSSTVRGLTLLVGHEVTERAELGRQLARSDEILRIGAHELRNPLHVIGMICHLLENRAGRGDPLDRGTVERLRRQMHRLDRIINQLLDLSRVQEDRLSVDLEDTDLSMLVHERAALVDSRRAADLQLVVAPGARARTDHARLGDVMHQLMENAVRFTDPGTPIKVDLAEDASGWRFSVEDHGPGIPPEDQALLFQRHVRIDRRRGPQGLGLGLYIAARVVERLGGTIEHQPVEPTGARFIVRVPRP